MGFYDVHNFGISKCIKQQKMSLLIGHVPFSSEQIKCRNINHNVCILKAPILFFSRHGLFRRIALNLVRGPGKLPLLVPLLAPILLFSDLP